MTPLEAKLALAASAQAGAHEDLGREWPTPALQAEFTGVSGITAISPTQLRLTHGGASGTITFTGVNFSASDTITGDAGLTVGVSVPLSTSIVLTVSASGGAAIGLHSITYNGQVLRGLVRVV